MDLDGSPPDYTRPRRPDRQGDKGQARPEGADHRGSPRSGRRPPVHRSSRRPHHHGGPARRHPLGRGGDALGYEHLRRHDLRHTGLTWMADAGVPVHVLRKIAGHGSLSTTQRYLHPDDQTITDAGDALSAHIRCAGPQMVPGCEWSSRMTCRLAAETTSGRRDLNPRPLDPQILASSGAPQRTPGQQLFGSPQRSPVIRLNACPLLYLGAVQPDVRGPIASPTASGARRPPLVGYGAPASRFLIAVTDGLDGQLARLQDQAPEGWPLLQYPRVSACKPETGQACLRVYVHHQALPARSVVPWSQRA